MNLLVLVPISRFTNLLHSWVRTSALTPAFLSVMNCSSGWMAHGSVNCHQLSGHAHIVYKKKTGKKMAHG